MLKKFLKKSSALATAACALISGTVVAGVPYYVDVNDSRDPADSSDDLTMQVPVEWKSEDPINFYLFRPFAGGGILDPANQINNPINDDEVVNGFSRAFDNWDKVDADDVELGLVIPSDSAPTLTELPFGPIQVQPDTFNLVTFRDGDAPLGDGVLSVPVYYFFRQDFDPDENGSIEDFVIFEDSNGIIEAAFFDDRETLYETYLPKRKYDAGELVEVDLIMNGLVVWNLFPEDPDELENLEISIEDTLGQLDVQVAFTKAIGQALGLAESHIFNSVMTPFYVTPGDANAEFLTFPYDARELELDDELGLLNFYGGADERGIKGNIFDGAQVASGNSQGTTPGAAAVVDSPVFFGRPLAQGSRIDLDTIVSVNPRFNTTEEVVGPIQALAHTLSGRDQTFALSTGTTHSKH